VAKRIDGTIPPRRLRPLDTVVSADLAMLAEAAESLRSPPVLTPQPAPFVRSGVIEEPGDLNIEIQREIDTCRRELERLKGVLARPTSTRKEHRHGNTATVSQPTPAASHDLIELTSVTAVDSSLRREPCDVVTAENDQPAKDSSTRHPPSAGAPPNQERSSSINQADQQQSQTSTRRASTRASRPVKGGDGSPSSSPSSDRSGHTSPNRRADRRRHSRDSTDKGKSDDGTGRRDGDVMALMGILSQLIDFFYSIFDNLI